MGASALVCASRGGHASVVRSLLEAGASVNNKLGTVNPLMSGAIAGHESVCRMLIDKGADVNTMMKVRARCYLLPYPCPQNATSFSFCIPFFLNIY